MKKSDLNFKYSWTVYGDDDPKIRGILDSTFLNRNEGYEVLYFINEFIETHTANNLTNLEFGEKVEKKIHKCPGKNRSQKNIKDWIIENWN